MGHPQFISLYHQEVNIDFLLYFLTANSRRVQYLSKIKGAYVSPLMILS